VILRREAPHLKPRISLCGAQRSPATKTRRVHEECCASRVWWVIIKIFPVEAVVYQDTKLIHPCCRTRSMAHIASTHSPDRNFHRWISFTDSKVGLILVLCSQTTFDPSSVKAAHATPTEKSTPSLVPRYSPVQGPHGHCRRSSRLISFRFVRRSPIMPMASRIGLYLPPNSLQRLRSTARGPHILTFATQRVNESLKNLSPWDESLLCSGCH